MLKIMEQNEIGNKNDYYAILVFTTICTVLFLVYLSLVIFYIIKNYHKKKLCIFWIDYCSLIFGGILFTIIYLLQFFFHGIKNRIDDLTELSKEFFAPALIISLSFMCFTLTSTLLFDAIMGIRLSIKMNKMKKVNDLDLIFLSEKLNKIDYVDILKMKSHHIYTIIFFIINSGLIVLEIFTYIDLYFKLTIKHFFNYIMRIYHFVVLIFLLISIFAMNYNKRSLLKKEYNNPDRIAQKIYDAHFSQIVYFTDVISFKLVADLIMNIPASIFMANKKFNTLTLIGSEIAIFLYIFFGGSEYFVIDKDSKAGKINKLIKKLFCLKKLDFHFGEKDVRKIIDDFNFDYSSEERKILDNLNIKIIKNVETKNLAKDDTNNSSIIEMQNTKTKNKNLIKEEKKFIDFKLTAEFYLVQKLLMIYFEKNSSMYEKALKAMEENGSAFKNIEKDKRSILNNKSNLLNLTVDTINQLSSKEGKKLLNLLSISQKEIFCSFEEKEIFEELRNKYNLEDENIFQIESLFSSILFDLFPFYQMSIKTILQSINPSNNLKLFKTFVRRNTNYIENYTILSKNNIINIKNINNARANSESLINKKSIDDNLEKDDAANNSFSGSIIKNNIDNLNINKESNNNINDNKNLENNLYYTYNLFLMYEIYDVSELIDIQELKNIINEYHNYILTTVKTLSYSFLPLIIGIYKIKIFDSEKILILYRNPLYFSNLGHFNRWVNFYLTEEKEKMKVSSIFNDIIEVNNIEMNNNIELYEADYDEIKSALEQDFSFMNNIGNIYPILHLFIGEEYSLSKEIIEKRMKKQGQMNFIENSILFGERSRLASESNVLIDKDKDLIALDLSNNFNNTSMPNLIGADDEINLNIFDETSSLMDKEYFFVDGNNLRTIKIYFTNLFRKDCEINKRETNINMKLDSNSYCVYLQDQILNYLSKKSLFKNNDEIEEEKDDEKTEKEEKDNSNEIIKIEENNEDNINNDV